MNCKCDTVRITTRERNRVKQKCWWDPPTLTVEVKCLLLWFRVYPFIVRDSVSRLFTVLDLSLDEIELVSDGTPLMFKYLCTQILRGNPFLSHFLSLHSPRLKGFDVQSGDKCDYLSRPVRRRYSSGVLPLNLSLRRCSGSWKGPTDRGRTTKSSSRNTF